MIRIEVTQEEAFRVIREMDISFEDKMTLNTLLTDYGSTQYRNGIELVKEIYKL